MATISLVTLPIGNIDDLTPRAREILSSDFTVLAEDTRKFFDFIQRSGITRGNGQVFAFHDHTQGSDLDYWLNKLNQGENLLLVSDAGSPIISDPAYPLVRRALDVGHQIQTYPGVSAVTTALELSGLPPHPFYFHGFIAREGEKKRGQLENCGRLKGTHIFFESPQRMDETLKLLQLTLPAVQVAVARELTKTYESVYRFQSDNYPSIKDEILFKGEFVLLFHQAEEVDLTVGPKLKELANEYLNTKSSPKTLAKIFAEITGMSSKDIYQQLISHSRD